jgi:Glycosyl hydrolase catalytic core
MLSVLRLTSLTQLSYVLQFSCSQVLAFMKQVVPWLEQSDFVAGYAWFSFMPSVPAGTTSSLFRDATGDELTPLGRFYASVTSQNILGDQSIAV